MCPYSWKGSNPFFVTGSPGISDVHVQGKLTLIGDGLRRRQLVRLVSLNKVQPVLVSYM